MEVAPLAADDPVARVQEWVDHLRTPDPPKRKRGRPPPLLPPPAVTISSHPTPTLPPPPPPPFAPPPLRPLPPARAPHYAVPPAYARPPSRLLHRRPPSGVTAATPPSSQAHLDRPDSARRLSRPSSSRRGNPPTSTNPTAITPSASATITPSITPIPSDLALDSFERVASEHLDALPADLAVVRNDSASANLVHALRFTFQSLQSYGHTDKSSASLLDDNATGLVGGAYAYRAPPPPVFERSAWSAAVLALPSKVEEAAGRLYRSGSIDDHWILRHRLGAGACSEVRLGEPRLSPSPSNSASNTASLTASSQDCVAIKIVSKAAPDLFCPITGDCREVVALSAVTDAHHIVRCHEVYEDDRFIYIVMELLTGGQLLPRVADKAAYYPRYCENDVVVLVRALVRALNHLHSLGIAHRDVKPENVLYLSDTKDPTVKLTDFGISHARCNVRQANDMVGTPLYVAPEVLLRRPYGCAADMWSLGVIVHILLAGYPPFDDDDLVQLVSMVKHHRPRLDGREWHVASPGARDFVARLLERDPDQRLTAEDALAHPWITAPRPPPFPAPPMPARKLHAHQHPHHPLPQSQQATGKSLADAPRQDGALPLVIAQVNLQDFVRRKEFKRRESEHSDRNVKLSMLVSLSEKDLKISNSAKILDAGGAGGESGSPNRTSTGIDRHDASFAATAAAEAGPDAGETDEQRRDNVGKAYGGDSGAVREDERQLYDARFHGNTGPSPRMTERISGTSAALAANVQDPSSEGPSESEEPHKSNAAKMKGRNKVRSNFLGTIHSKTARVSDTSGASSSRPPSRSGPYEGGTETSTVTREDPDLDHHYSHPHSHHPSHPYHPYSHQHPHSRPHSRSHSPSYKQSHALSEHDLEQERLRQHRLRIQAELSRKKKMGKPARKSEETSVQTGSVHSDTLSSGSASSNHDDDHHEQPDPLMLTNSKFSEDSMLLHEAFPSRRDADAQDDMDTIQKQRGDGENGHKQRVALLGRRSRQSSNTKQSVKSEKARNSRGKGKRGSRRQRASMVFVTGQRVSDT